MKLKTKQVNPKDLKVKDKVVVVRQAEHDYGPSGFASHKDSLGKAVFTVIGIRYHGEQKEPILELWNKTTKTAVWAVECDLYRERLPSWL